jgi:D-glycero-alpha-D-manno-heptose-7-phosphate kinase
LRVSFAGGGTDFKDYYVNAPASEAPPAPTTGDNGEEYARRPVPAGGCVLSTAIDKYIYVIIKERFDEKIRVGYSRTEMVDGVDQIEHELVREAMRRVGVARGIEISTMADIPSEGSGPGFVVVGHGRPASRALRLSGRARHARPSGPRSLPDRDRRAAQAIGKQDQYIAAYGGLRLITFCPDESVLVESVR